MKTTLRHSWLLFLVLTVFNLVHIPRVLAATGDYQKCTTNADCTVGEFLYDDNYVPITNAACTLTSRYPDGTVFINSATLPPTTDGWYAYNVGTSGQPLGLYRGQICCTSGTDYLCLDKSFTIDQDTAQSVWNYNNRTISSFGNIVGDIWNYSDRSLSGFGSLVSDIWSNSNKTLSSSTLDNGTTLATTDTVNSIGSSLAVLSSQVSTVQTDVSTISDKIDSLQTSVNSIQSNTNNILSKWSTYSVTDILNYIDTLNGQLGNNTQSCTDNTVFGQVQCLIDKWGTNSASTIYNAANNAYTTAVSLQSELNFNGKSTTAYDELIAIKAYVDTLETSIGSTADTSATNSIFGRIKQVKEAIDAIDQTNVDVSGLLAKWGTISATDIYSQVQSINTKVNSLNTVSNVENITNNTTQNLNSSDLTDIKNQLLAMKALLNVNRTMLESVSNKPIIQSWLEEGSIIFKSLITNPSKSITQDTPFVYYFPPEVKQSDIIKKSDSLDIKYDPAKATYYATGNFTLKPGETIIVEVEVNDIWTVPQERIDSLKKQADELFAPLKNTSYFAQGSTIHSDILSSLDKVVAIQDKAKLPEDKINAYQDTKIEMDSISRQMDSLKSIVSSAGSIGTLSGFIGGVQTMAVWGIVVILVAGFAFLALYIKSLNSPRQKPTTSTQASSEPPTIQTPKVATDYRKHPHHNYHKVAFAVVFGLSLGLSSIASYYFLSHRSSLPTTKSNLLSTVTTPTPVVPTQSPVSEDTTNSENFQVLGTQVSNQIPPDLPSPTPITLPSVTPSPTTTPALNPQSNFPSNRIIVTPSINSYVNLRSAPDRNSELVTKVLSGQDLTIIGEKYNDLGEKWFDVTYNQFTGWILAELTQAIQSSATAPSAKITIIVPPFDTVYLYSRPSFNASITSKITDNQSADILVETKRWAKIILARTSVEGWVSQDFIQKINP